MLPTLTNVCEKNLLVDIYRFLSKLFSKPPKIVVVIDEKTLDLEDACNALKYEPDIVEFKTFVSAENPTIQAHLFEPIYSLEETIDTKEPKEPILKRKLPEHYKNWENHLQWTNAKVKGIVNSLTNNILNKFPEILHKPIGRYYCFYRGRISSRSRFVAIILHKNDISIRIRADPKTLSDPKNLLKEKVYKGWFFGHGRGQEREFKVTDKGQLNYAMELIKQSYDSAK